MNKLSEGVLPKFVERTALAGLNSITGLMNKQKGGESPGSLKPFCTNAFSVGIVNSIKYLFVFQSADKDGGARLFVII